MIVKIVIMKTLVFVLMAFVGLTCGQDIDRIFKGWFLSPHEFPWMVKLKVRVFKNYVGTLLFLFLYESDQKFE